MIIICLFLSLSLFWPVYRFIRDERILFDNLKNWKTLGYYFVETRNQAHT